MLEPMTLHTNSFICLIVIARLFFFLYLFFFFFFCVQTIMLVTVTTDGDEIYNLEIDSQMAIEDFKALLEAEVKRCLMKS